MEAADPVPQPAAKKQKKQMSSRQRLAARVCRSHQSADEQRAHEEAEQVRDREASRY